MSIYESINAIMQYGEQKELYNEFDYEYILNSILAALHLSEYVENDFIYDETKMSLDDILNEILKYAIDNKIISDSIIERDLLDTKIMGCLTPLPSMINERFFELYSTSPEHATNYFYTLCKNNNYVRTTRISKDIHFDYFSEYGKISISINMSKPEKNPEDIKKLLTMKQSSYPKCMLCKENVNYEGRLNFPARQNLRFIPLVLSGSLFYMQYSPYSYYNEHTIVFKDEHSNMKVDMEAVEQLVDFVEMFPHYFIGSNAGLPIVGGSILNHHHFQGGRATLPMEHASKKLIKKQNGVSYYRLTWPLSVIRLVGKKKNILQEARKVFASWDKYQNKDLMIIAFDENGNHNAITPIVRKNKNDYEIDLVLRNNIQTPDRPLGLFHPRSEYWNIKKENIGLIEVMGLAILPSRLKYEMEVVRKYLLNMTLDEKEVEKLKDHKSWADNIKKHNTMINEDNALEIINTQIAKTFVNVLKDCAVFNDDNIAEFENFIINI